MSESTPRNVLVVGANRGIGLEVTRQLAARGDRVTATCRSSSPELDALEGVTVRAGVDVRDPSALRDLAGELGEASLDELLVVAGIMRPTSLEDLDEEAILEQFEVNALGPLRVVAHLEGCLRDGAKVGLVTSRMGSIADNTSGGSYGYRMSKAALNMAGRSLALDLKARGVSVMLLHPGYVRTDMTGGSGFLDADESAAGLLARLDDLGPQTTGTFYHQSGEELPW